MPNPHSHVGTLLRDARKHRKLTQTDVATALGLKGPYFIYKLENGMAPVPAERILQIASLLCIEPVLIINAAGQDFIDSLARKVSGAA